ncbi:hypothetical protein HGRIS_014610 [Hohenbuehelia grisea]|uniref:Uncharacterized protein n=1 Tax=Hohenbuehelia grisea TaxID=104357 RepID=A0ABR3JW54_9AGAR
MSSLRSFTINCTFVPPSLLLRAILDSPSITQLSIHDTPMNSDMLEYLRAGVTIESLSLTHVGQAVRVGEGYFLPKFGKIEYFVCEYRQYFQERVYTAADAARSLIQTLSPSLRYLDVSGSLCAFPYLANPLCIWERLQTLVLTGTPHPAFHLKAELADVVGAMPVLTELRVLFSPRQSNESLIPILPTSPSGKTVLGATSAVFSRLKSLAMSNTCNIKGVLVHTPSLERLAICALFNHPRVPTALNVGDVNGLLDDIREGGFGARLRHLRVMIEYGVSKELCQRVAELCPNLLDLEIEQCGYQAAGGDDSESSLGYADALAGLTRIQQLRVGIPFRRQEASADGQSDSDSDEEQDQGGEAWRIERRNGAQVFAARFPALQSIGFEHRGPIYPGSHRYVDEWLDFEVLREPEGVELVEAERSWYNYPETWRRSPILADNEA